MANPNLAYLFSVSFKSCAAPETWFHRFDVRQGRDRCKSTPYQIAGEIAAHYMKVEETGILVKFIGIQKTDNKGTPMEKEVTSMNPFTLTLTRDKPYA